MLFIYHATIRLPGKFYDFSEVDFFNFMVSQEIIIEEKDSSVVRVIQPTQEQESMNPLLPEPYHLVNLAA